MNEARGLSFYYHNKDSQKDLTKYVVKAKAAISQIEANLAFKNWFNETQPQPSDLPILVEIPYEEWKPGPWK